MLTEYQTHIIIVVLLMVIIYMLYKKQHTEDFETVCKNGQCFECANKVYRDDYCLVGDVDRKCPDGYFLNNNTLLCNKNVVNEQKNYVLEARPQMICNQNELQVGNSCVLQPKYYFDPNYI
jgi:hypothetical protein